MPFKHQTDSYRVVKGERFVCWSDIDCDDVRAAAKAEVAALRAQGVRTFVQHHPSGYSRVFIHEAEGRAAGILAPERDAVADMASTANANARQS